MKNSLIFYIAIAVIFSLNATAQSTLTFTSTTVGWYRITSPTFPDQGGRVTIFANYDNSVTDIEFQYNIAGYYQSGSIQQTRYSSYEGGTVDQLRISSDGAGNAYLDIHVSSATSPGPITIVGYGPVMPAFIATPVVGATAGSTNINVLTLQHGFNTTQGATFAQTGGNVGIGTSSPYAKLHIVGGGILVNNYLGYKVDSGTGQVGDFNTTAGVVTVEAEGSTPLRFVTNAAERMTLLSNGYVGIGTTTPDELLAVDGNIHAKEVRVDLTGWEDRVFKRSYKLPLLSTLKTYIDLNHHLPDMPSENELLRTGLNVGAMEKTLTKKVEEMTLYMIDLQKQNDRLKLQLIELNKKINKTHH